MLRAPYFSSDEAEYAEPSTVDVIAAREGDPVEPKWLADLHRRPEPQTPGPVRKPGDGWKFAETPFVTIP